ncbi:MAG: hypothetical protein QME65_05610 [Candidatus Omnitrophota bacterium]|nr:hypothetical protein [Candidatus Omnitrophota bacterium]
MTGETFPTLLWALLLQDFPESLVTTLAVFSLLNLHLRGKRTLYVAFLETLTNLVRLLPIAFGIHTVILMVSLVIYTRLFTGARLSRIFAAVLVCFGISVAVQVAYFMPLLKVTGLTYETVFANPFLRAAFALPYEVILLLLALGKNYYNCNNGLITAD